MNLKKRSVDIFKQFVEKVYGANVIILYAVWFEAVLRKNNDIALLLLPPIEHVNSPSVSISSTQILDAVLANSKLRKKLFGLHCFRTDLLFEKLKELLGNVSGLGNLVSGKVNDLVRELSQRSNRSYGTVFADAILQIQNPYSPDHFRYL